MGRHVVVFFTGRGYVVTGHFFSVDSLVWIYSVESGNANPVSGFARVGYSLNDRKGKIRG